MKFDGSLPLKERILKRRRQRRKRFFILLVSFLGVFVYSAVLINKSFEGKLAYPGSVISKSAAQPGREDVVEGKELQPASSDKKVAAYNSLRELKQALESYISGYQGKYGIYYMNLANNEEFGINHTDEYIAASTIKIPLNLYLFEKISTGYVKRDGLLTYTEKDYEDGTGEIRYETFGKKYRIYELARLSIEKSDNVAANMLFRFLEKKKVKDYMRLCGGMVVKYDSNVSCPKDMATYMKLVYEFGNKNGKLGKELIGYFKNANPNNRIPGLLPESVEVAHKTGDQVRAVHDVGIVYAPAPYVLAVMSSDVNEAEAQGVIATVSRMIYDYVVSSAGN